MVALTIKLVFKLAGPIKTFVNMAQVEIKSIDHNPGEFVDFFLRNRHYWLIMVEKSEGFINQMNANATACIFGLYPEAAQLGFIPTLDQRDSDGFVMLLGQNDFTIADHHGWNNFVPIPVFEIRIVDIKA